MPEPKFTGMGSSGDNPYFNVPRASESEGWEGLITLLWPYPVCYIQHVFGPMEGQSAIEYEDGTIQKREREQRMACLGCPQTTHDPRETFQLDAAGVKQCQSIKLPNGQSLHEQEFYQSRYDDHPTWRVVTGVFNHISGQYEVFSFDATNSVTKNVMGFAMLQADRMKEQNEDVSHRSYAIKLTPNMEMSDGGTKYERSGWNVAREPLPTPLPNPNTEEHEERWERVQDISNPFFTPEAAVQWLGIEQFNPDLFPDAQQNAVEADPPQQDQGVVNQNWGSSATEGDPFGGGPVDAQNLKDNDDEEL